ncbi:DUF6894 family protein [Methylobacterium oryzisoli]|uniref:DUF6894 family protein n=1 Tax=Methylobacterium oryzisoli TaxID=3385502 RepID=UPI00389235C0
MARYFIDVHNSIFSSFDDLGRECTDPDAVSTEALRILCNIAQEEPLQHMHSRLGAIVRDENGHVVLTANVTLSTTWVGEA